MLSLVRSLLGDFDFDELKAERSFRQKTPKEKKGMLDEHREALMLEHAKRQEAERQKREQHHLERAEYLKKAKHLVVVQPMRNS